MKITFVTGNKNKFAEAIQIIPELEMFDLDLVEIQEVDSQKIIEAKLNEARKHLSGNLIVEDNALSLETLGGLPGPLIKWFEKTIGIVGLYNICELNKNYSATAKVTIGFIKEDNTLNYFEGEIKGKIVAPRGENGFGWDSIFEPAGKNKTFAEMTAEEKNKISMRKIAFQKLANFLKN